MSMNKKKIMIVFFCVILSASCNNRTNNKTLPLDNHLKENLISDVFTEGSIDAYNSFLFNYPDDIRIVSLSVTMAEQHGYGKACSDFFYTMYSSFNHDPINIDSATQKYLLSYLYKGVDLNDTDCVWIICKLFLTGTFVEKDTSVAKQYLTKIYPSTEVETLYWPYIKKHPNL